MAGNLAYAITIPGILKMVTVAFCGIFVLIPTCVGIKQAKYLTEGPQCGRCPEIWEPWVAALIVIPEFLASLIVFIILLVKPLNESAKFKIVDIIGHAAGGVLSIGAGALAISYAEDAQTLKPCYCPTCKAQRTSQYAPETFMAAGAFMIINGIVYIATAVIIGIFEKPKPGAPATPNKT